MYQSLPLIVPSKYHNMSEESKAPEGEIVPKNKPVKANKPAAKVARPASPQPSTSAASTPSTSSGLPHRTVYSHIEGVDDIQHLGAFRPGRRRSIYRLIGKAKLARQVDAYEEAIKFIGPIFKEETRRKEEAATLVESAIENFATTVNNIVDLLEGKTPVNENAATDDKIKNRLLSELDKKKLEHPELFEDLDKESAEKGDEKEEAKRLQEEIEAAIVALTSGDKKGEKFPDLFCDDLFADERMKRHLNVHMLNLYHLFLVCKDTEP